MFQLMNMLAPFAAPFGLALSLLLALAAMFLPRRAGWASGLSLALTPFVVASGQLGPAASVMLVLVVGLGAIILRFSRVYLAAEPGLPRYQRWLLLTLSAVTTLVVANHLLVMALAWTATSLSLHQLLTFYPEREAALVAAHKKFLVSRLADACLAGCLALVQLSVGSLGVDDVTAWVRAHEALPPAMEVAALLLVLAVCLRSAQLPFHGWLTQVMEAPTPVSALLHAGVVNIGGFLLIRLAPWLDRAELASLMLVVVGLVSAVVAAVIMTTRVSVKVALAWSTCAQMGFMLVQCGLGLWPLAMLHLVAHSLYKAHAFLSAGSTVDEWKKRVSTAGRRPILQLVLGALFGSAVSGLALFSSGSGLAFVANIEDQVLALLLGLSVIPLLATHVARAPAAPVSVAARVLMVMALYLGWHWLAGHGLPGREGPPLYLGWGLTAAAFVALFVMKATLQLRPHGTLARAMHPWLFSGLYLDELFTRLTFRVWPPRLPKQEAPPLALSSPVNLEVHA